MNITANSITVTPGCGETRPSRTFGTESIILNSICTDLTGLCTATAINEKFGAICNSQNKCEIYFPDSSAKVDLICDGVERRQNIFTGPCNIQCTRVNNGQNTPTPGTSSPRISSPISEGLKSKHKTYGFFIASMFFTYVVFNM